MMYVIILVIYFFIRVESYSPNPRAIHPNGKLPTIIQAKRKVQSVRQAIFQNYSDAAPIIILVDGNNIRNSFGFQSMSAVQLTEKMSFWSKTVGESHEMSMPKPQIVCVWDGGQTRTSQRALSTLAGYSGPDGNADDLIVQCCSFLSSQIRSSTSIDHERQTVVVFTSDANLANRCLLQSMEDESSNIDFQIYHSIHLCLLLEDEGAVSNGLDIFAPDWEREERRTSVTELQSFVENTKEHHVEEPQDFMVRIGKWINGGLEGLKIGRVTKGGSILYTCQEEI